MSNHGSPRELHAEATPFVEIREGLGDEHKALAARLLEVGLKLDLATLAAAAAGLRDTSVLEQQLRRARDVGTLSTPPPPSTLFQQVKYTLP